MDNNTNQLTIATRRSRRRRIDPLEIIDYAQAENAFAKLLPNRSEKPFSDAVDGLQNPLPMVKRAVDEAISKAFSTVLSTPSKRTSGSHLSHRFLQRLLYQSNHLRIYDPAVWNTIQTPPEQELVNLRDCIQDIWQSWETSHLDLKALQKTVDVVAALRDRLSADQHPPLSENARFFRDQMTEAGFRQLLAIACLNDLTEPRSPSQSTCSEGTHAALARLAVVDYDDGRLNRPRSAYLADMLSALNMNPSPDAYFDEVPWEQISIVNHAVLLHETPSYFLRYIGRLLFLNVTQPTEFHYYCKAAQRLGLPPAATSYWDACLQADSKQGQSLLDDIALPMVVQYPDRAWELLWGYDQQRLMSHRSGVAIARAIRAAERSEIAHSKAKVSHASDLSGE